MKPIPYHIPINKPQLVLNEDNFSDLEQQLSDLDAQFRLREVELTFKRDMYFFGEVRSSQDVSSLIRQNILNGIEIQEHFIALFMNNSNQIIGYYHHSRGTISSTPVDIQLLTATAVRVLARGVIVAHNHPSGSLKPSEADRSVTQRIREALKHFDIKLLDHLIITSKGYYSFADSGEGSLGGTKEEGKPSQIEELLREEIMRQFKKTTKASSPNLFAILSTQEGYRQAEEIVIRRVLHDGLVPEAIIPLVEQEMEMV